MSTALHIPEIIAIIFEFVLDDCDPTFYLYDQQCLNRYVSKHRRWSHREALRLALTCKAWYPQAINYVWRDLPSLVFLLKLLPG
jgi:hypothetical protein